ncbi:MAG: hypothetical protein VCD00_06790 [Candidatus Hydrogenedentota bacterium]
MPRIVETIPDSQVAQAEAARAWFAQERGSEFKLTGIVDPGEAGEQSSASTTRELQLILCGSQDGHEVCLRKRFKVTPASAGFDVIHLGDTSPELGSPAPLLDPPPDIRKGWLDTVVSNHAFVVLVFYRGFW